jgi:cell division septum initiation protein DivIVA
VSQTIAKNIEKANDRIKSKVDGADSVSMSDDEASKDTNWAIRENANNTAHNLTETIRVNASGILKGFKVVKQEMVGPQEVAVTIRWDLESERMSNQLRRKFDGQ